MLHAPGNHRVAHHAHAVRVRDHHRAIEEARIFDPCGPGHFAVAVEGEPAGKDRILKIVAAGKNGSHTRPDRADTDLQRAATGNESGMPDFDAFYVGDGIERALACRRRERPSHGREVQSGPWRPRSEMKKPAQGAIVCLL